MAGKVPVSVDDMKIDLASLSSHKIYGPKGIGAIYVRRKPRVRLESLISGGGQVIVDITAASALITLMSVRKED